MPAARLSPKGGTLGQAVSMWHCNLRKSAKPGTELCFFKGWCHNAWTQPYVRVKQMPATWVLMVCKTLYAGGLPAWGLAMGAALAQNNGHHRWEVTVAKVGASLPGNTEKADTEVVIFLRCWNLLRCWYDKWCWQRAIESIRESAKYSTQGGGFWTLSAVLSRPRHSKQSLCESVPVMMGLDVHSRCSSSGNSIQREKHVQWANLQIAEEKLDARQLVSLPYISWGHYVFR